MELKSLNTFVALAEELHFTRTAQRLHYAQSSVTFQIQALEKEFGVALFERTGKRVRLTEAGKRLHTYARAILQMVDEARASVPGDAEPRGTLTVGAVESLCAYRLSPILAEFRARHPKVEMIFRTGVCADLRRETANGTLDLAFTLEEVERRDSLESEVLLEEPMRVLASPNHPLAQSERVTAADLGGETLLLTEPGCSYRSQFEHSLAAAGIVNAKIEFASVEAIKQSAMAGLGVTLLPGMAVGEEIAQGRLAALRWAGPGFPVFTQLCLRKDRRMSPALRAFVELARETLPGGAQNLPSPSIAGDGLTT